MPQKRRRKVDRRVRRKLKKAQQSREAYIEAADPKPDMLIESGGAVEFICAAEGDDNQRPTFQITAYTGRAMSVGYSYPVVVDLASLNLGDENQPIFRDHDPTQIVGHTTSIDNSGRRLAVSGVVSGVGDSADSVVAMAQAGFPWRASIGARPGRMEFVESDATVKVNGRRFSGPLYVARGSTLREVSFVPIGADNKTSARVAASEDTEMGFEAWCASLNIDIEAMSDEQVTQLRTMYEASIEAGDPGTPGDPAPEETAAPTNVLTAADGEAPGENTLRDQIRQNAANEVTRVQEIQALCRAANSDLEAQAISEGWTPEQTELRILRSERSQEISAASIQTSGNQAGELHSAALEASTLLASGMPESAVAETFDSGVRERVMNFASSQRYRGTGIRTLMHETLRAAGVYARTDIVDNDVIRQTFQADAMIQAAGGGGGFSTTGLSGILSNVANKSLLAAYQSIGSVVDLICATTDTNDFKEFTRFRLNGTGLLEQVGPDGEIKHTQLDEQAFPNKLKTWANMLALTREMMINDDLGAFTQIPTIFGRMAAVTRERQVFQLILSNPVGADTYNFFSNEHNNFNDGADSVLDIDGLSAAVQLFRDQKGPDGNPILVPPTRIICGTGLETISRQLFQETRVNELTPEGKPAPANNPHVGNYQPVISPYMNSAGLTGESATAWILAADPGVLDFAQIAYLRGQRTPVLESAQVDFNTLGMQWRTYFDFGVALSDYRAAVWSAGA